MSRACRKQHDVHDDAFVELERVDRHLWRRRRAVHALAETSLRIGAGRLRRAGRPVGLRQVDHPQAGERADPRSARVSSTSPGREIGADAGARRHGVPESDPAAVAHDPRQRDAAAEDRAAVPRANTAPSARASSATAPRRCSRRSASRGFGDKHPWQLSGGMMQRASLCRALIHDPAAPDARRAVRRARPVHPRGAVGDHAEPVDDAEADRASSSPTTSRNRPISPTASA